MRTLKPAVAVDPAAVDRGGVRHHMHAGESPPGEAPVEFASRHIGPAEASQARMLEAVGYASLDELTEAALPAGIAADRQLRLPAPLTEAEMKF